ncbi:hypothetical protein L6R29_16435 [Myxococcota bacterium]|nr:hypothetical protein [Myxococcota bacterium]
MTRISRYLGWIWLSALMCFGLACQVPSLSPHLKPCQTSVDCGGLDCNQGLCGSTTSSTEPSDEKSQESANTEPSNEKSQESANTEPSNEPPQESVNTESSNENPQESVNTEPSVENPQESVNTEPSVENPQESVNTEPTDEKADASEDSPETTSEPIPEPAPEPKPDLQCQNKETRPCYSGTSGTQGKGECKEGTQTCDNGVWGPCQGQVVEKIEECNNKDDDCDGTTDDGVTRPCSSKCGVGKETCSNGTWGNCDAQVPTPEDCNGKDDDCDGAVDNNLPSKPCSNQKGVCNGSKQTCVKGAWVDCTAADYAANPDYEAVETKCDGKDNDCNDKTDEHSACICTHGATQTCYPGTQGCPQSGSSYNCTLPCKTGTQTCQNGQWTACIGAVTNKAEECNGIDDDCDGQIDNNLTPVLCSKQSGVCSGTRQTCQNGGWVCDYAANPDYETKETKCDGKDNDCNGSVDDASGCVCIPNTTQACYNYSTGCFPSTTTNSYKCTGICKAGTQTCHANGKGWGDCLGEVPPQVEQCNNLDDDCNGTIDDNVPSTVCYTITTQGSATVCAQGNTACKGGSTSCESAFVQLVSCKSDADCSDCPTRGSTPAKCAIMSIGNSICRYY